MKGQLLLVKVILLMQKVMFGILPLLVFFTYRSLLDIFPAAVGVRHQQHFVQLGLQVKNTCKGKTPARFKIPAKANNEQMLNE